MEKAGAARQASATASGGCQGRSGYALPWFLILHHLCSESPEDFYRVYTIVIPNINTFTLSHLFLFTLDALCHRTNIFKAQYFLPLKGDVEPQFNGHDQVDMR